MLAGLTRRINIATLWAALMFASRIFIPIPFDRMATARQALLLRLGFLSIGRLRGTYLTARER